MNINRQNFKVYAAKHYDNPFCLTEVEFESDLFKASVIKKLITAYIQTDTTNIKLLVNATISFFNVFDHHAAATILKFKLNDVQYAPVNAILMFLSLPTIDSNQYDEALFKRVIEEYK